MADSAKRPMWVCMLANMKHAVQLMLLGARLGLGLPDPQHLALILDLHLPQL